MAVEFRVEIGEYRAVVRISRRVFQHCSRGPRRQSGASKPTIFSGPGSN
jgi:hypothetical protein